MNEQFSSLLNTEQIVDVLDPQAALYLLTMLIGFFVGKKIYDVCTPFNLNEQLTSIDNKAVALSFSGYLFGLGIILWAVLSSESTIIPTGNEKRDLFIDLFNTVIWGTIGIFLLQLARVVNDQILFSQFNNIKELVTDRNVGTGAVECGSFIGSAFIVRAAVGGDDQASFITSLMLTFIYFIAGQLAFIIFGKLYQAVSRFDLHKEIENDNVSAGVSFGMSLIAIGILMAGFISKFDSLIGLAVWFGISVLLLLSSRYIVDKVILPGPLLDEEISKDRNWGAALVEGCAAIGVALLCTASI